MLKRRFLMALTALSAALASGCGHGPSTPTMARGEAARAAAFSAAKPRNLGFDIQRYRSTQRPVEAIHPLPPLQGLLPAKVDMRAQCSPIANQYDLSSCTAFAVGKGLREFLAVKRGEADTSLSALFLYYETRRLRGKENKDCGATLTDAMKALSASGMAPEGLWPYDTLLFAQKPGAAAYQRAEAYKLDTGVQIAGLAEIKKALAKGAPVVFGMALYDSYRSIGPDGLLPMPQANSIFVGGHAVTAVGYDNKKQVLIIRNSEGPEFGDHGYFYMPYAYVTDERVMDIWTAK